MEAGTFWRLTTCSCSEPASSTLPGTRTDSTAGQFRGAGKDYLMGFGECGGRGLSTPARGVARAGHRGLYEGLRRGGSGSGAPGITPCERARGGRSLVWRPPSAGAAPGLRGTKQSGGVGALPKHRPAAHPLGSKKLSKRSPPNRQSRRNGLASWEVHAGALGWGWRAVGYPPPFHS